MNDATWSAVDEYVCGLLLPRDHGLDEALRSSVAAQLPAINVSPAQGKFLHLLAKIRGARNILEIGTLGGYSTIWLARALPPDGRVVTLEIDPRHAEVASGNIARAGLTNVVELRVGRALEVLPQLEAEEHPPFDFVFIDADKPNIAEYFNWALRLSRPGSVIVVDNVVRAGAVIDGKSEDASVQGVRRFNEVLATCKRVDATVLQTVGTKGYDGFALALVVN
jgi:predicted O-methyltransferase YrrM